MSERLWIDTEFNEFRGELISIALVDEAGREFYEVLPTPLMGYGPWVKKNVVPILNKAAITRAELQAKLHLFLAGYDCAHLVADWPEDIQHFLDLLIVGPGQRIGPDRWTMEVRRDLPNTADTSAIPHNALEDVKALRACHLLLEAGHRTAAALSSNIKEEGDRCHAALMGRDQCAHFCGAAQCNAGVPASPAPEKHRCSAHPWHKPDCPDCIAQNTGEDASGVPGLHTDQGENHG